MANRNAKATPGCSSRALWVAQRWRKIVVLNTATCVTSVETTRADKNDHSTDGHFTAQKQVRPFLSAVAALELAHEAGQRLHAFFRERVVNRCADSSDRAVPLQAVHPGL